MGVGPRLVSIVGWLGLWDERRMEKYNEKEEVMLKIDFQFGVNMQSGCKRGCKKITNYINHQNFGQKEIGEDKFL